MQPIAQTLRPLGVVTRDSAGQELAAKSCPRLLVMHDLVLAYGAEWVGFVAELERRLAAKPQPASKLTIKAP